MASAERPSPPTGDGLVDAELAEQPEALERLLRDGRQDAKELAGRLRRDPISHVVIAARGSSDNAARYAQYVLGARHGLNVSLATPSLHSVYQQPPQFTGALVAGISQSGQSPDIVAVLADARAQGRPTLAVTNDLESPLASTADHVIDLRTGPERAVAATKTYTNSLGAIAMLSAALRGDSADDAMLAMAPERIAETIAATGSAEAALVPYAQAQTMAVVGRGFGYGTAHEIALKIKELTGVVAAGYSAADLIHGPIAAVHDGFGVFVVALSGPTLGGLTELVGRLRERGARIIIASDDRALTDAADTRFVLPDGPEWLAPLWATVPGQVTAITLTRLRGADPDNPSGLSKVTHTT